ncbi:MAG: hypothetical protein KAJ32_03225 [Gammaproteobacteria bacterium]|nr:hypothetical protein [Gammaproteobacteria bacterium]
MQIFKTVALSFVGALMIFGTVQAAESTEKNALSGMRLGFGFDQGFSVVGAMGNFYGALGDDGAALDYIFVKKKLNEANPNKLYLFVGGGGFVEWDGDWGARLPIGAELYFAKNLDAYAAAIPRLRFNNNKNDNTDFGLDFAIGVRYQF